jgi:4-methylaminobutanoate oxidase (formaldehyde-forming)
MSFMAKYVVQGRDAGTFLSRLSTNHVNGASGMITYTQWLDDEGKMQADVTVIKLSGPEHDEAIKGNTAEEGKFIVIATDTMLRHVETWMRRHVTKNEHVFIHDVTGAYAQINIQGICLLIRSVLFCIKFIIMFISCILFYFHSFIYLFIKFIY